MKVKVIHVKVDGPDNQQQIERFEELLGKVMSDATLPSPQHVETFVTQVGQTSSVWMTAIVRYYDPLATPGQQTSAL
jgi:hypothetical protein